MPTNTLATPNTVNIFDESVSEEAVKDWITELTDFTPQQIEAVLADRQRDHQS